MTIYEFFNMQEFVNSMPASYLPLDLEEAYALHQERVRRRIRNNPVWGYKRLRRFHPKGALAVYKIYGMRKIRK